MQTTPARYASSILFGILVLAWTAPFAIVGHTYPIPTFYAEYTAAVLFLLLGATCGYLVWRSYRNRQLISVDSRSESLLASPRVAIVPLGFAALIAAQTLILPTQQPSMNLLGAAALLLATISVHAGFWTSRMQMSDAALRWIAWALIAGGLFAVGCQVVQLLHLEARFSPFVVQYSVTTGRRPFGNMAQANHLATYIAFALAAAVYLVQSRQMPLAIWVVLAAVYSFGLALTVSRMPWLQVIVIVALGVVLAWSQRQLADQRFAGNVWHARQRWAIPFVTLAIFIVINALVRTGNTTLGWQLAESAADRFQDAGQISPRLALWRYGWTMFTTHPWLGVGWGEFPRFEYQFVEQLGRVEIANNSHDIVIDILAKTGLAGGLIVALGLGFWVWRIIAAPRTPARLFAMSLLALLAVHTLVEYPQQYLFFLLPAAYLFGLLESKPMKRLAPGVSGIAYAGITVAGLAMAYPVLADYHKAETLYYGDHPEHDYRAAPSFFFGAWGEFGLSTLLSLNTAAIDTKLAMHQRAIALLPGEVAIRRYAILLALDGNSAAALDQVVRLKIFAEALHDWPNQLASLYETCRDNPHALAEFQQSLTTLYGAPANDATPADDDD